MSTGGNSGRREVQGIDGAPVEVDGTVDVGNLPDDNEVEILADSGAADRIFLRRYVTDDAGVVTIVDTDLDGTTAYVVTAEANVVPPPVDVTLADDTEGFVLCDSGTPFIRRFVYLPDGSIAYFADSDLAGAPYVVGGVVGLCDVTIDDSTPIDVAITGQPISVDDNGGSLTVDGSVDVDNFPDDFEWEVLCDNQGGDPLVVERFLRRYDTDPAGVVTVVDRELDGTTPYVASGTIEDCGESGINTVTVEGGAEQSGFGGVPIVTRVVGAIGPADTHTTDADARRVSIYWTSTAASLGNRATIQINAGPVVPLANAIGDVLLGTLASSDVLGYTITVQTNQNNDDLLVVEEF